MKTLLALTTALLLAASTLWAIPPGTEFHSAKATGSVPALTNRFPTPVTFLDLPAGDFDISGNVNFRVDGAHTLVYTAATISSGSFFETLGFTTWQTLTFSGNVATVSCPLPSRRFSLPVPTRVVLFAYIVAAPGTPPVEPSGYISAVKQ